MSTPFFPAITPSRSDFRIVPASKTIINPFNQVETVIEEPGDKWQAQLRWRFLRPDEVRQIRAFLHSLRGQSGLCLVRDTAHRNLGTWAGAPVVDGSGQYGTQLSVRGFSANQTVARAGDRFTLNNRLHEVVADIASNNSGQAVLVFEPEIITPASNGQAINHADPFGRFMLADPRQIPSFSQNKAGAENVAVNFTEALR